MGFLKKTPAGHWRANWREPSGRQRAKTFRTKKEAAAFLADTEASKTRGTYVSPHAGRTLFGDHAREWMATWNTSETTTSRDMSVMRTHVMPRWADWPLAKIDHLSVQQWVTDLGRRRGPHTVSRCYLLLMGVLRSAVRNRLIATNPGEDVKLPKVRRSDTDERIISLADLRALLPVVPPRHCALIATTAGTGLRWGEAIGLRRDAFDLERPALTVIRTVIEVNGHTSFKPFPKSSAGRRTVPIPRWVMPILLDHLDRWPAALNAPVFANEVGAPLRRSMFRRRVWRPSLVRAGLLGTVDADGEGFAAIWTDETGEEHTKTVPTRAAAVALVAEHQAGGLRFHDLRHSYATWLVDDGVPPNMVQRVLGHERSSTTMDLYTRRTDDADRVLDALSDDDDDDQGDDGSADVREPE